MRVTRWLVVVLAVLISPVGAAVCEVVCGTPLHAAAHAPVETAPADHSKHHQHSEHPEPPQHPLVSDEAARLATPASECPPLSSTPARLRTVYGPDPSGTTAAPLDAVHVGRDGLQSSRHLPPPADIPPKPPHHAPVPLRI